MTLPVPQPGNLDYAEILAEITERVRVHTPEYTNIGADSDPGYTILQSVAWIAEQIAYRADQIPERNRRTFLNLLGIPLRPAAAAVGVVTFDNQRGPLETVTLPSQVPLFAGELGFATDNALDVLPVEAEMFYRRAVSPGELGDAAETYQQLYDAYLEPGETSGTLQYYQTAQLQAPKSGEKQPVVDLVDGTVDGCLWVALLARRVSPGQQQDVVTATVQALAGRTLTLGILPQLAFTPKVLRPTQAETTAPVATLHYAVSSGQLDNEVPSYTPLQSRSDDDPLRELSLIQLTLPDASLIGSWREFDSPLTEGVGDFPPYLDDEGVRSRVVAWVRVSLPKQGNGTPSSGLKANLAWVGINAARITQRTHVHGEFLGVGNGEPDQSFTLMYHPVLPEGLRVSVDDTRWTRVEDLMNAPSEVGQTDPSLPPGSDPEQSRSGDPKVFSLDPASGEIRYGDGLHGMRLPSGARVMVSYAHGGGRLGNLGIGVISDAGPTLPAGYKANNPLPTGGGSDGMDTDEADKAIPAQFRNGGRAVSQDDFLEPAENSPGVDMGRVAVRSHFHPQEGSPAPGVVTVMVIPNGPPPGTGLAPDPYFLDAVCRHLEPRRLLTTEVHVVGPDYVDVAVSIGVDVIRGESVAQVRNQVEREIYDFLSPFIGGFGQDSDALGWPLDQALDSGHLTVPAARVNGVSAVRQVLLWGPYDQDSVQSVPLAGLQLPRLTRVVVTEGAAEPGVGLGGSGNGTLGSTLSSRRLPVPTVPPEC